ncbi:MAG: 2,3-dihydro-2,3-dihydroxybenzoate dehydrogenase [Edaphobacter sp.]|nr:2,3-dihydro-2,3-dihydroxybenzoate dehydrogenase [Edaphobacter sp.]
MADQGTIGRIGGILKNTYGPKITEQQNLIAFTRNRYGKADNDFYRGPGDHFEWPARVGGNRASVAAAASDDPLLTPSRQKEVKFSSNDRSYTGNIKVFVGDMQAATGNNAASFISHKADEMTQLVKDITKVINIDLCAGDGSGTIGTIAAGATSATQTLAVGTGAFQYGSQYLQNGDVIDIYDATLTTSRTSGAGLSVSSITRSTGGPASIVLSGSVTTTTGDIVTRGPGRVNKAYTGFWGATHNQGITFQGQSTGTFPQLSSNRIPAGGQSLTESLLRQLQTVVTRASGEEIDEYLAGFAQYDEYESLGFAQKRFTEAKLDKGYTTLAFGDKMIVKDVDMPNSAVYGINKASVKFGEVSALGWQDDDGSILKQVPGFAAYSAYMIERGQMIYTNPNRIGVIDGLSFGSVYAQ